MSNLFCDRLLTKFVNVKHRLESLLSLCRIEEHPSWINDEESGEFSRFCGPYRSDVEELESSISSVSTLIDNLRHELNATVDRNPFPNYPLCRNGWTMEKIERLNDDDEKEKAIDLKTFSLLRFQTFAECLNDERCRSKSNIEHLREHRHDYFPPICSSTIRSLDEKKNLLDLPVEILLLILSNLSPCELINSVAPTCRCFAELILRRLYSHLDLCKLISIFDVLLLFDNLFNLQSIRLIDWESDVSILTWSIWFDVLSRRSSNLRSIRFRNVLLCPILISLVVEYFPFSLQTIIFDCQQQKTYDKFDLILCLLADSNIRIKHLTASYQLGITNFGILQFVSNVEMLIELNLIYIESINDQTVKVLCDKHEKHLEILKIDGAQLTDRSLDSIGQCFRLKSILIEFCVNLTGFNFSIFHNLTFLKELSLSKLTNISAECFQFLFNSTHHFPHLILLTLGECHLLDDICVQLIVQTCPRLKELTCSWAYGVTDVGFNEIVSRCVHLKDLSLIGCYRISGQILIEVPTKYFQSIRSLNFEQCNQIEDQLLIDLYRRNKSISIINYYGTSVNDDDEE